MRQLIHELLQDDLQVDSHRYETMYLFLYVRIYREYFWTNTPGTDGTGSLWRVLESCGCLRVLNSVPTIA